MDLRLRLTRMMGSRAYVKALLGRADSLERRAADIGAETLRRVDAMQGPRPGELERFNAVTVVIEANTDLLAKLRTLRRAIHDAAGFVHTGDRSERRSLLKDLERALVAMENGIAEMEQAMLTLGVV